jgi:hypothetical protein
MRSTGPNFVHGATEREDSNLRMAESDEFRLFLNAGSENSPGFDALPINQLSTLPPSISKACPELSLSGRLPPCAWWSVRTTSYFLDIKKNGLNFFRWLEKACA